MAKKNADTNEFESAPDPTTAEPLPEPAYPAVLQRVRFIGGDKEPFSAYLRGPMPPLEHDNTFELDRERAVRLARYYPDRYELVRSEPAAQEG